jgi:hypothetical protein
MIKIKFLDKGKSLYKNLFCSHYFSPLNAYSTVYEKRENPDPDPEPELYE